MESTGVLFRVEISKVDEDLIIASNPLDLALARSIAKSQEVSARFPGALVIGADQVLGMEGESYGKAPDAAAATERLRLFSGKSHLLHSAFSLSWTDVGKPKPSVTVNRVVNTEMKMRSLSEAEIAAYIATGEWRGCAGCYQAENRGVHLMDAPMGESSAIVGLPLPELLAEFRMLGICGLTNPRGPWIIDHLMS